MVGWSFNRPDDFNHGFSGIKLDIEAIPDSDFRTKRNLLLATNQVPDILEMGLAQAQDFADSGAIAPLMDLIDEYNLRIYRIMYSYDLSFLIVTSIRHVEEEFT